jgi:hypothetical protein
MTLLSEASFLVTPNGYKEDKLYAAIPTNGNGDMTVTRATTATRVNEAGLVELVPYNLLLRSQEFDNAIFQKNSSSVSANTTTAPDGTLTADTWTGDGTFSTHFLAQVVSTISGVAYTQSVFAKKGTNDFIQIVGTTAIYDANSWANFDLENGVVGTVGSSATATITDFGNGWYRCTMTATAITIASSNGFLLWLITSATASRAQTNSLATSVHLWGAQLVEGSTALTYQKTVDRLDIPRIDYTGGGCPSILLEPQRTNLFTYSEDFSQWNSFRSTVTLNATTSPDGTINADLVNQDYPTTAVHGGVSRTIAISTGVKYTYSIFVKKKEYSWIELSESATSAANISTWFDVEDGVVGTVGAGSTAQIEDFGNDWYRCSISFTSAFTGSRNFILYLTTGNNTATANIVGGAYIFGAQLEAGAYPTSYIPTTTATVTRNADVINRGNIYTNNLITAAGGTWFVDLINNVVMSRDTSNQGLFIADSSDGTTGNAINIRNNSGLTPKRLTINKQITGSQTQIYVTTTDHVKVAIKWNGTTADVFVNGAPVVSATSFTTTDMEFFSGTGGDVSKYIKQMALFPTPLTDAECIALTTL